MPSAETLIAELHALGLHFVVETTPAPPKKRLSPVELLAGLAGQEDARLRLALIAVFLYRPGLAEALPDALAQLDPAGQTTLKLFYTAAVYLQHIHAPHLQVFVPIQQPLPDFFAQELGISSKGDPQERLRRLSRRHRDLTGLAANWFGTYQHAATRVITRLEKEASWAV
ncbi:MAG: hypothetical protein ACE5GO_04835 [Anaerolineales bacterium]